MQMMEFTVIEAGELPSRRCPTPGRGRMPDGGPQSADDGVVDAGELPALRHPTPGRGQMPDGGQQSAN